MRPHEKLDVWKWAIDLVTSVYQETKTFPKEERFGLTSQIRRAAVSIPATLLKAQPGTLHESSDIFFQMPKDLRASWRQNF
jgi:hypothetical protein